MSLASITVGGELHDLTRRATFPFLLEFSELPHAAAPNRFEGEEAADMLGELAGVIELHYAGVEVGPLCGHRHHLGPPRHTDGWY